ncbi:hypothetical protein GIB67_019945 [Kingdonia uniflora]|uniref:Aminotransferase-like plant mobile domain-containing protein n=1 Tax=Kingdonia uniflora TaxID=39325 RepID=A0A7J7MKJ1_9MAGN|nr:hypothetical protein GIB67_019945 [Kingdonia uniflora]
MLGENVIMLGELELERCLENGNRKLVLERCSYCLILPAVRYRVETCSPNNEIGWVFFYGLGGFWVANLANQLAVVNGLGKKQGEKCNPPCHVILHLDVGHALRAPATARGWIWINFENREELQCRRSLDKVLKWYRWIILHPTLKKLVDGMGFEDFCLINAGNSDNRLIHALVERWWPFTHTFHFPCGELGFTPLDFIMLTGISFGRGRELPYDERYSKLKEVEKMFPGITSSDIRYDRIEGQNQHRLATMAQVQPISPSRGKTYFSAEHPEGSIGVSLIRPRDEQKKEENEAKDRRREERKFIKEAEIQRRREAELTRKKTFDNLHMLKVMTTDPSNLLPAQRRWMKKQIKDYSKKLKEQCPSEDDVSSDKD